MRIISGTAAGVILQTPKGLSVRPTPDLVRQAVFNSLGARVQEAATLELFAGTGALTLECLSRGAISGICVEKSSSHARFIRENAARARIDPEKIDVRVQDAFAAIGQLSAAGRKFDLLLADPPFGGKNVNTRSTSFAQKLLDDRQLPGLLQTGGIFILGHTKRDTLDFSAGAWTELKMLKHGDSVMRFLTVPEPKA